MHSKGVVHRDFNPNNVFITKLHGGCDLTNAKVKIIDFNISQIKESNNENKNSSSS